MSNFLLLLKAYFVDLKLENHKEIFKQGLVIKLFKILLFGFFYYMCVVNTIINKLYFHLSIFSLFYLLITYTVFFASHIIVKDGYIEFVKFFVKRKKINIDDIKSCKTVNPYKGYIRGSYVKIRGKNKNTILFNYNFWLLTS